MTHTAVGTVENRYVSRSTWTALSCRTLSLLTTVLVLAVAASLTLASMGAVEDIATVALVTAGVVAVGLAIVRLFAYLEANGLPLLE